MDNTGYIIFILCLLFLAMVVYAVIQYSIANQRPIADMNGKQFQTDKERYMKIVDCICCSLYSAQVQDELLDFVKVLAENHRECETMKTNYSHMKNCMNCCHKFNSGDENPCKECYRNNKWSLKNADY